MMLRASLSLALAAVLLSGPAIAAQPQASIPSPKASRSLLLDVASAGSRLVAVGERGHILYSEDQGKSWQQAAVPTRALLSAVYFPTDKTGYAVGHDSTVLRSRDGGLTWELQYFRQHGAGEAAVEEELPAEDEAAWEDDGSWDEEDDGRDAVSREGVPLLDVWFADESRGVAVGAYGLLLRTTDGGATWQDESERIANRDGWHFNAIAGVAGQPGVVLIAGEKGTLYRSQDYGANFTPLNPPVEGSFFGLVSDAGGTVYAFGLQGALLRSANQGSSWQALASGVTSGLNDGCLTGGKVIVTGNAGVVITIDGDEVSRVARSDRQSVLSCVAVGDGLVLVGEGGARRASARGLAP